MTVATQTTTSLSDACPICGRSSSVRVWSVPFADVWKALADRWHAPISDGVRARYSPTRDAVLVLCSECDLEYFSPHNQGMADFYDELMAKIPYEPMRWEFAVVRSRLQPADRVVDYGCGSGAFLAMVTAAVDRAVGVDHAHLANAELRARGIEAFRGTPAEFAEAESGYFDVACAFQVLEHLSAADELLPPMLARLAPGGRVFVSVPNRHRIAKETVEPLDCPPHHVSRWSVQALGRLADRYGMDLVAVTFQPPTYGDVVREIETRLHRFAPPLRGEAQAMLVKVIRRALVGPARHDMLNRRGWWVRHGFSGHTMLAELRRRPEG